MPMGSSVVIKQMGANPRPVPQPFLYPPGLFESEGAGSVDFWVCVRTRPRWEKKFAEWMRARRRTYFLPVFRHETTSGRKRRVSQKPLFPGFVFAAGNMDKRDFAATGCVAYVLRPRGRQEADLLRQELRDVWRGLTSGLYVEPVQNLAAGEACRIAEGPLRGVEAKFERMGREGRLILQVELLGGGIAVEVPADAVDVG
ncbi:MAG: hypothetical protein EOL90_08460 [Spartobacteria bacterium]|nr:hypothetical protein [Spartobacteria bacterium]